MESEKFEILTSFELKFFATKSQAREAIEQYRKIKAVSINARNIYSQSLATGYLGIAQIAAEDFSSGFASLRKAMHLSQQLFDRKQEFIWKSIIGHTHMILGDYGKAYEWAYNALNVSKEFPDVTNQVYSTITYGTVLIYLNEPEAAWRTLSEALIIAQETEHTHAVILWLLSMSLCYRDLGDFEASMKLNDDALALASLIGDRRRVCLAQIRQGTITQMKGDSPKALKLLEIACEAAVQQESKLLQSAWHNNMGIIHVHTEAWTEALDQFQKRHECLLEILPVNHIAVIKANKCINDCKDNMI